MQGASTSGSPFEEQLSPGQTNPLVPMFCPSVQPCALSATSVDHKDHPDDQQQPVVPVNPAISGSQSAVEVDDSAQGLGDYPWRLIQIYVPHHSRYDGTPSDPRVLFHGAPVEHGSDLWHAVFREYCHRAIRLREYAQIHYVPGEPRHWRGWNVWIFLAALPTSQGRSTQWMKSTKIAGYTPLRRWWKLLDTFIKSIWLQINISFALVCGVANHSPMAKLIFQYLMGNLTDDYIRN